MYVDITIYFVDEQCEKSFDFFIHTILLKWIKTFLINLSVDTVIYLI